MPQSNIQSSFQTHDPGLKQVLQLDAATCVACGLLLSAGAGALSAPLGLPQALLLYAGLSLFPAAALMLWASAKGSSLGAWLVVGGNAVWAAGSLVVLWALAPTALGVAFVAAQALAVVVLTLLEVRGLRRGR